MKLIVGTKHLEDTFKKLPDLVKRANEGDRQAEKTLKFAERYGHKGPFA